jgi:AbrB family looped-hinge helix DNA binding protein
METIARTKGQIVIPSSIRRKFGIQEGTKFKLEVDEERFEIVLKPITRETIKKFRGILKLKPGTKPAVQQLLDDRKEDLQKEEAKVGKHGIR